MKHRFKIVGKFRDPIMGYQFYGPEHYLYFVVFRCANCETIWKVERSWLWVGKVHFDLNWSVCTRKKE